EHWVMDRKNELLELLKNSLNARKDELQQTVLKVSSDIVEKLAQIRKLIESYSSHKEAAAPTSHKQIKKEKTTEIKTLKRSLKEDWKLFRQLSKQIMRMQVSASDEM